MSMIYIDRFSIGLDDLARQEQGDDIAVLRVLAKDGRFNCFEASENRTIAGTVTRLMKGPYIEKFVPDIYLDRKDESGLTLPDQDTYPWTYVRLTPAGESLLRCLGSHTTGVGS